MIFGKDDHITSLIKGKPCENKNMHFLDFIIIFKRSEANGGFLCPPRFCKKKKKHPELSPTLVILIIIIIIMMIIIIVIIIIIIIIM